MRRFLLFSIVIVFLSSLIIEVTCQRRNNPVSPSNQGRRSVQGRNPGGNNRETEGRGGKFPLAYIMADGAEDVIGGPAQETFTCEGRDYGYYADMENNCQLYHICVPPNQQYTFFCNNGTVFDQKALTCVREEDSTPCGSSEKYYALNQNFGVIDNNALLLLD